MIQAGHIYLDVTDLSEKHLRIVYKSLCNLRRNLGIDRLDMREGAPTTKDGLKALECVWLVDQGCSVKEMAEELGFPKYDKDNPSGSYPQARRYLKLGRDIQQKLHDLNKSLPQLPDNF